MEEDVGGISGIYISGLFKNLGSKVIIYCRCLTWWLLILQYQLRRGDVNLSRLFDTRQLDLLATTGLDCRNAIIEGGPADKYNYMPRKLEDPGSQSYMTMASRPYSSQGKACHITLWYPSRQNHEDICGKLLSRKREQKRIHV